MEKTFVVQLQQIFNSEDFILPIPEEVVDQLQLNDGDTLIWKDLGNGSFILEKNA